MAATPKSLGTLGSYPEPGATTLSVGTWGIFTEPLLFLRFPSRLRKIVHNDAPKKILVKGKRRWQ